MLAPAFFEPLRELAAAWHDRAAGAAAGDALAGLAETAQPAHECVGQVCVVFDHQYAHGAIVA